MKRWLKKQNDVKKTREKIKLWREEKKKHEKFAQIRKEPDTANDVDKWVNTSERKNRLQNDEYRKRAKFKLGEWKEMKEIKESLEESEKVIKSFATRPERQPTSAVQTGTTKSTFRSKSLSARASNPKLLSDTAIIKEPIVLNILDLAKCKSNPGIIKSFQDRDLNRVREKREILKYKKRKSFEEIHPITLNPRFNSSQIFTSSMIDLSTYNNPTQSSQAKTTHLVNNRNKQNQNSYSSSKSYQDVKKSSLMQIEHIPRLRTPAWRTFSVT